jgi:hypothetical protein
MPRPIVATFSVEKAYRSALEQRVVISGNGTTCDIAFAKGVTYLVYANEHAGALSRLTFLDDANRYDDVTPNRRLTA